MQSKKPLDIKKKIKKSVIDKRCHLMKPTKNCYCNLKKYNNIKCPRCNEW